MEYEIETGIIHAFLGLKPRIPHAPKYLNLCMSHATNTRVYQGHAGFLISLMGGWNAAGLPDDIGGL